MLKPISKDTQRLRLRLGLRLFLAVAVHVHTRQFGHFGDPPSVTLTVNVDAEGHVPRIPDLRVAA